MVQSKFQFVLGGFGLVGAPLAYLGFLPAYLAAWTYTAFVCNFIPSHFRHLCLTLVTTYSTPVTPRAHTHAPGFPYSSTLGL